MQGPTWVASITSSLGAAWPQIRESDWPASTVHFSGAAVVGPLPQVMSAEVTSVMGALRALVFVLRLEFVLWMVVR